VLDLEDLVDLVAAAPVVVVPLVVGKR